MEKQWYGDNFKLGVLGGGQLGRMMIQSAINFDIHIHAMDTDKSFPCGKIAHSFTEGGIQSFDDVMAFGKDKDVITVEIEHVNVDALEELEKQGVKVFPQPRVLRIIQDKGLQKEFYKKHSIPTAPFTLVENKAQLMEVASKFPFIQKLRKGGYDGKGVAKIQNATDLEKAFDAPSILEEYVPFEKELSIIVARNEKGEIKTFPLVECEFSPTLNLVEFLFSPANVSPAIEEQAEILARKIIQSLDLIGLLAVELFLTKDGSLLVNEVAPRTHNSGHHTIECNITSQFEQHLRAITNQPLGSTKTRVPGVMVNLIGAEDFTGEVVYKNIEKATAQQGVHVHLYGKSHTKPGRKMGHITVTNMDIKEAKRIAREIKEMVVVGC